ADLYTIRHVQSGDIVYTAQENYQQREIQRRDNNSWSVVKHEPIGGPYQSPPEWASKVVMTTDAGDGTGTMTASSAFFSSDDVDSIIAVDRAGRLFEQNLSAVNTFTDAVEVNGATTDDRSFSVVTTGTWSATLKLYRSVIGPDEGFAEVTDTDT